MLDKALDFIKRKDEKDGTAWSECSKELAKAMVEFLTEQRNSLKRYSFSYQDIYCGFSGDVIRQEINGIGEDIDGEVCFWDDIIKETNKEES